MGLEMRAGNPYKGVPNVMAIEFQCSDKTCAATPWVKIKGTQPTCHTFQCHYVDWFHPAINSLGEWL